MFVIIFPKNTKVNILNIPDTRHTVLLNPALAAGSQSASVTWHNAGAGKKNGDQRHRFINKNIILIIIPIH